MSPEGRAYKEAAVMAIRGRANLAGFKVPHGARLRLSLALWWPDNRRTDLDNRVKVLQDAAGLALRLDDCRVDSLRVDRMPVGDGRHACELTIEIMGATK